MNRGMSGLGGKRTCRAALSPRLPNCCSGRSSPPISHHSEIGGFQEGRLRLVICTTNNNDLAPAGVSAERAGLCQKLRDAARGGAHYISVVQNLPEQRLPVIIDEARKWRLPVTGAIVSSWAEAARMGLAGYDHFVDLYRSTARVPERDQFLRLYRDSAFRNATAPTRDGMYAFFAPLRSLRDESYYRASLATMARAGTPVTTNMASSMWAQQANAAAINERRRYAYPDPPQPPPPPTAVDGKSRDGLWSDIRDMREAGVQILAGTTAENSPRDLPGATLLDELEWLVRAGLTPREALAAATVTPAAVIRPLFPRVRAAGKVAAGAPADLVMLEANPLQDIANARKIFGVIANGRWFGPAERQSLLERAAELASHPK